MSNHLVHFFQVHWCRCIHCFGQFSDWIADVRSAVFCLVEESSYSTPVSLVVVWIHLVFWISSLLAVNLGVLGVEDDLSFIALSPNFFQQAILLFFPYSYGIQNTGSLQGYADFLLKIPFVFWRQSLVFAPSFQLSTCHQHTL